MLGMATAAVAIVSGTIYLFAGGISPLAVAVLLGTEVSIMALFSAASEEQAHLRQKELDHQQVELEDLRILKQLVEGCHEVPFERYLHVLAQRIKEAWEAETRVQGKWGYPHPEVWEATRQKEELQKKFDDAVTSLQRQGYSPSPFVQFYLH